jgi:hypothetical protein
LEEVNCFEVYTSHPKNNKFKKDPKGNREKKNEEGIS